MLNLFDDKRNEAKIKYGFIYITINKINGMKYIGKCIYDRKACSWKTYLGSGLYLQRAIRKYGKDNFYKIIIDEADTEEELRDIEEYYIDMFDAVKNKNFYNLKNSSMGGNTYSYDKNSERYKERIEKVSKATSGKNNPMYGKPKTQKMISAVKKANSLKVKVIDKDDIEIVFESKNQMIDYYVDIINKEVSYNKSEVKNLKRTVAHYLHCKENKIVNKTKTKNKLKNIKNRIYEIKEIKLVKQ